MLIWEVSLLYGFIKYIVFGTKVNVPMKPVIYHQWILPALMEHKNSSLASGCFDVFDLSLQLTFSGHCTLMVINGHYVLCCPLQLTIGEWGQVSVVFAPLWSVSEQGQK